MLSSAEAATTSTSATTSAVATSTGPAGASTHVQAAIGGRKTTTGPTTGTTTASTTTTIGITAAGTTIGATTGTHRWLGERSGGDWDRGMAVGRITTRTTRNLSRPCPTTIRSLWSSTTMKPQPALRPTAGP